jgi:flagellar hook-basal body complex protein FliE
MITPIGPLAGATNGIGGVGGIGGIGGTGAVSSPSSVDGPDFAGTLADAISAAGDQERTATEAADRFAAGDPTMGIHEVMIQAEKASVSLRFATTVKNQAIAAYRELMNTPI